MQWIDDIRKTSHSWFKESGLSGDASNMGLTCLVRWKNATGIKDSNYIAEKVKKSLHGKKMGDWKLYFKVYDNATLAMRQHDGQQSKKSEKPEKLYQVSRKISTKQLPWHCMADGKGGVIVEADHNIDLILPVLKNLWKERRSVTLTGDSYEVGDFTLRVANILIAPSFKGLLLEVEYRPCSTPNTASKLIDEFVNSILPPNAQLSCEYEYDYKAVGLSNHEFTAAHTGYQYMMLFRNDKLL